MSAAQVQTADVRTTESCDGLVVTPRGHSALVALAAVVRNIVPGARLKGNLGAVWVPASDSDRLLDACSTTDFRWTEDAMHFAKNRQRAKLVVEEVRRQVRQIVSGGLPAAQSRLQDCKGLDELDDHQWVNVAAMTVPQSPGLCVFDEQGAGKTVTLIFAFDVLVARDQADFVLIIAPKSMISEWPHDFTRFMGDRYRIAIVTGSRRQKEATIASRPDVVVTNFESIVSLEDEFRAMLRSYGQRAVLVVDESFFVKNLDAKRTRAIRRIREWSGRAFVLCGTPAPNSPRDLIEQFNIVDFGLTFTGVVLPEDDSGARDAIKAVVERSGLFVRHLKQDVLTDLPAKSFNRILLQLQPVQSTLYRDALGGLIRELQAVDDQLFHRNLVNFLARRSALLQICSNPRGIVAGYTEVPAKLQAIDELLRRLIEDEREKVVLWSFYTASIDSILARYGSYNPVRYDGSVTDVSVRRESVRRFQEDDQTMLFVANPAAAGAGLTLHRARYAMYESLSNQTAHYLQSLDRIHRRGQKRAVEYLVLLCDGTIELQEYDRLTRKERAAQELLGDDTKPPLTRQTMLAEALAAQSLIGTDASVLESRDARRHH